MRKRIVLKLMFVCCLAFLSTSNPAASPVNAAETAITPAQCLLIDSDKQETFCYVLTTVAMLRERASLEIAPHATFPIGTKVRLLEREGDWINVYAYGRKNDERGWMYLKDLQKLPPSLESITLQFKALPVTSNAARLKLAEQAIALAPLAAQAHQLLFDVHRDANDSIALKQAQALHDELMRQEVKKLPDEQTLIFAVDNGMLSPFAAVGQNGLMPAESQYNENLPNAEQRVPPYFRSARALNFYQRGAAAGKLRVKQIEKIACESDAAGALDIEGSVLNDRVVGLASNQALPQPDPNHAMAPNAKQNLAIDMLLRKGLKANGVKKQKITELLQAIQIADQDNSVQRFVISSGKTNREWLLTSFAIELREGNRDATAMYYGFLVAEKTQDNTYRTMHFDSERTGTGENYGALRFLDYLDLDQDGINEIVFVGYGFEAWWYEAWSFKNKQWKRAAFGGGGGC
jgi:hypothetical protein